MTEGSERTGQATNEGGSQERSRSGEERQEAGRSPTGLGWLLLLLAILVTVVAALFAFGLLPFSRSPGENQGGENVTEVPLPPWETNTPPAATATSVPGVPSGGSVQAEVSLETQLLLSSLSNQIHQLVGDKRNLTQRVEDAAERDKVLRSVLNSNIVQLSRLNGERVSDNVERYLMGANPSVDGTPPARPAQQGPLRVANYTWNNQEHVGGFWVNPGAFARVRIHAGVRFNVDPDSGLVVVVIAQGGINMPFSEWQARNPRPPVERFEISNPEGASPLYCSFLPN